MSKAQRSRKSSARVWFVTLVTGALIYGVWYELENSRLQAHVFTEATKDVGFRLEHGESDRIVFPKDGPYDARLGYTKIPKVVQTLEAQGFEVTHQARVTPQFQKLTAKGVFPLFEEKDSAGLKVLDRNRHELYRSEYPGHSWKSFDEIPPLVVDIVKYVENRALLDGERPSQNPALEWKRMAAALADLGATKLGATGRPAGGSTLATQLEKFRHSPEGRTRDVESKLQQMMSASLRAYMHGEDTIEWQKRVVLAYVNTVPLAAIEGYGEVHGIPDGLAIWFGEDVERTSELLRWASVEESADPALLMEQAKSLRQVVSLVLAHRRPSELLKSHQERLHEQTDSYLRLMMNDGVVPARLAQAALMSTVDIQTSANLEDYDYVSRKLASSLRGHALSKTDVETLYELDRYDATIETTVDLDVQHAVEEMLRSLSDSRVIEELGVERFGTGSAQDVIYSFTLYEKSGSKNVLRVQADTLEQPLNINEHIKIDLGSTAKLRTLATYLHAVNAIFTRHQNHTPEELSEVKVDSSDALSRWTLAFMARRPAATREDILKAAMNRRFSANPNETFFTGGGLHTFSNFSRRDNHTHPTVLEAFERSVNLPFVRIMREVVRYYMYNAPGSSPTILDDAQAPERRIYLERFADMEGSEFLRRFEATYRGLDQGAAMRKLYRSRTWTPRQFLAAYRAVYPEADVYTANAVMKEVLERELPFGTVRAVFDDVDPEKWTWNDRAYLAKSHPLELWLLRRKGPFGQESMEDLLAASTDLRQHAYEWLFKPHQVRAQNIRIRMVLEHDAFEEVHKHWASLGYPFDKLVPSFATALGTSADRPDAIAELVGIILNDGVSYSRTKIKAVHLAQDTPYETRLQHTGGAGDRKMASEVAETLRSALLSVVEEGTAKRIQAIKTRPWQIGGKTGTGDHKLVSVDKNGKRTEEIPISRSATFAFFLEERFHGTMTAFVKGDTAGDYTFTSALPVTIVGNMLPLLDPLVEQPMDIPDPDTQPTLAGLRALDSVQNLPDDDATRLRAAP